MNGPKDVLSGRFPETADLLAAKAEVKAEMDVAKRVAPRVAGRGRADRLFLPMPDPPADRAAMGAGG